MQHIFLQLMALGSNTAMLSISRELRVRAAHQCRPSWGRKKRGHAFLTLSITRERSNGERQGGAGPSCLGCPVSSVLSSLISASPAAPLGRRPAGCRGLPTSPISARISTERGHLGRGEERLSAVKPSAHFGTHRLCNRLAEFRQTSTNP